MKLLCVEAVGEFRRCFSAYRVYATEPPRGGNKKFFEFIIYDDKGDVWGVKHVDGAYEVRIAFAVARFIEIPE
jgi:hypothetical protein